MFGVYNVIGSLTSTKIGSIQNKNTDQISKDIVSICKKNDSHKKRVTALKAYRGSVNISDTQLKEIYKKLNGKLNPFQKKSVKAVFKTSAQTAVDNQVDMLFKICRKFSEPKPRKKALLAHRKGPKNKKVEDKYYEQIVKGMFDRRYNNNLDKGVRLRPSELKAFKEVYEVKGDKYKKQEEKVKESFTPRGNLSKLKTFSAIGIGVMVEPKYPSANAPYAVKPLIFGEYRMQFYKGFFGNISGGISVPYALNDTVSRTNEIQQGVQENIFINNFTLGLGYVKDEGKTNLYAEIKGGRFVPGGNSTRSSLNQTIAWTRKLSDTDQRMMFQTGNGSLLFPGGTSVWGAKLQAGLTHGLFSVYTALSGTQSPYREETLATWSILPAIAKTNYSSTASTWSIDKDYNISWDLGLKYGPALLALSYSGGVYNHPYLQADSTEQVYQTSQWKGMLAFPFKVGDFAFRPAVSYTYDNEIVKSQNWPSTTETSAHTLFGGLEADVYVGDFTLFDTKLKNYIGAGAFYNHQMMSNGDYKGALSAEIYWKFGSLSNLNFILGGGYKMTRSDYSNSNPTSTPETRHEGYAFTAFSLNIDWLKENASNFGQKSKSVSDFAGW